MESRTWFSRSQPQTLVVATFLLYATAVLSLLFGIAPLRDAIRADLPYLVLRLAVAFGSAGAAYLIANERRIGWRLGVASASVPLIALAYVCLRYQVSPLAYDIIGLMFDVALVALLVHPMSREYEKVWFK